MAEPSLYPRPLQTAEVCRSGVDRDRFQLLVTCTEVASSRSRAATALWRRPLRRQFDAIPIELHHAGVCVARLRVPRDGTPLRWCLEHAGAWLDPAAFALLSGDAATLLRGTLSIERRTECPAEHLAAALWPPTPADHTAWMPDYRDVLALRQVVLQCTS